jgi:predicted DNA-binding transcriptional regulator AlpA
MDSNRPPAFPSKATLARELDVAESTVDELVRRGMLPPPIKLTSGCVRWCWHDVEIALAALKGGPATGDPYLAGVQKLHHDDEQDDGKKSKGKRRD